MHASNITYFLSPIDIFKVFLIAYFLNFCYFLPYCTKIVQTKQPLLFLFFAPADRMIKITLCQFVPCKSSAADSAAVLHMPVWDSLYVQHSIHLCSVV